jgi:hypothetical protein
MTLLVSLLFDKLSNGIIIMCYLKFIFFVGVVEIMLIKI